MSGGFNVSDLSKISQLGQGSGAEGVGGAQSKAGVGDIQETTQPSQQQQIDDAKNSIPMGVPILFPPPLKEVDFDVTIEKVLALITGVQTKCIEQILEQWSENVAKIADEQKAKAQRERIHSKESLGLRDLNAEARRAELRNAVADLFKLGIAEVMKGPSTDASALGLFMLTAVTLNTSGNTQGAILSVGDKNIAGFITVAQGAKMVSPEEMPLLQLVGNMINTLAYYPAAIASLKATGGKFDRLNPEQFARNFVRQMIRLAASPDFEKFISATLFGNSDRFAGVSPQAKAKMVAIYQLMSLFSALAMSYKLETKWLTGTELAGMLTGEMVLPKDDSRFVLIDKIKNLVNDRQLLSRKEALALVHAYLNYCDQNLELDELIGSLAVIKDIVDDKKLERLNENSA